MNMGVKKRVNGSWVDAPCYIYKTHADTFTDLPVSIIAIGADASIGLKGNIQQNGTPTLENPVEVLGCGERTENLADTIKGGINSSSGADSEFNVTAQQIRSQYIPCNAETVYFVANSVYPVQNFVSFYDADKAYLSRTTAVQVEEARRIEPYSGAAFMRVTFYHNSTEQKYPFKENSKIMVNKGETALPYEPYGYKISISSANTTTPVYLGEVETTRRVRKLVLTGKETWYLYSTNVVHQFYTQGMVIGGVALSAAYSTITPYGMTANNRNGDYGCYTVTSGNEIAFQMYGSRVDIPTQTEWKAYLAAQYAAGTPVTVWYVLAEPETAVVNEPLMKIGDYADEVSNISIPTITGKNIVDVETVLKPSEVSFNYTGWHTAVVHKRTNGAWD